MSKRRGRSIQIAAFVSGLMICAAAGPAGAAGPSFDCKKASSPDEIAICHNPKLAELDSLISDGYRKLAGQLGKDVANRINAPFFRQRRTCGGDELCIFQYGAAELQTFAEGLGSDQLPSWIGLEPRLRYDVLKKMLKIGECTVSTLREKSYRLCAPDDHGVCIPGADSGTSIVLANGMYGVSYDLEKGFDRVEEGDVIVACLTGVPKDCPAGDDRGYTWDFIDHRSGTKWNLPDSEHMCGGA